jgi:hypothetical protein
MGILRRALIATVLLNWAFLSSGIGEARASQDQGLGEASASPRPASWSRLSGRLARRKACRQQAAERGLSGRLARRYTRLCLSGMPEPTPMRRSP